MLARTFLLVFFLALMSPVYAGESPYKLLGLQKKILDAMPVEEAQDQIRRAFRIVAFQLHPDAFEDTNGTETNAVFSKVKKARDELLARYSKQTNPRNLQDDVVSASSAAISRGNGSTGNIFADAFGSFAGCLTIINMMEGEYRAATQEYKIKFGEADAVYQAAVGNGFGHASTYENYPDLEPAFHYFLMAHLDDLLFPSDGIAPKKSQIQKLYDGLRLSPHGQLEELLGRWLEIQEAGGTPDRCAFEVPAPRKLRARKKH